MKTLMMLTLMAGFSASPAFAVGRDQATPDCKKVIAEIQESLKRTRPGETAPAAPAAAPAAPAATAQ